MHLAWLTLFKCSRNNGAFIYIGIFQNDSDSHMIPNRYQRNAPPSKSGMRAIPLFVLGWDETFVRDARKISLPAPGGADISRAVVVLSPVGWKNPKKPVFRGTRLCLQSLVCYTFVKGMRTGGVVLLCREAWRKHVGRTVDAPHPQHQAAA